MASPIPRMRLTTPNFPGQDLVNKFIAATPSYMYTPLVGQHSFYFSELLRSLSHAKKAEMVNMSREAAAQQQLQANRKVPRKRTWPSNNNNFRSEELDIKGERPLELTSKNSAFSPNFERKKSESPSEKHIKIDESKEKSQENSTQEITQENLALPPPPPVWYPPLYSTQPYSNIDPANFFVDLRVSGHIFERKRELAAQALKSVTNNNLPAYFDNNNEHKQRIGSAFSVPKSRELKSAINLSNEKLYSGSGGNDEEINDEKPSTKKFYDNGVTVYNIDSDEEVTRGKHEEDSDEDETIAVDEN